MQHVHVFQEGLSNKRAEKKLFMGALSCRNPSSELLYASVCKKIFPKVRIQSWMCWMQYQIVSVSPKKLWITSNF